VAPCADPQILGDLPVRPVAVGLADTVRRDRILPSSTSWAHQSGSGYQVLACSRSSGFGSGMSFGLGRGGGRKVGPPCPTPHTDFISRW